MFSTVIVPLDGSAFAEQAIGPAAFLARQSRARLVLVRSHEPPRPGPHSGETWDEFFRNEEETYLEDVLAWVQAELTYQVSWALLDGPAAPAICARAAAFPSSIIMMSTHGRTGLSRAWLGSVADGVLRHTSRPVLMLRSSTTAAPAPNVDQRAPFANVIIALDGSHLAEAVLPHALDVATASAARVRLLRVVAPVAVQMPAFMGRDVPVGDGSGETPDAARWAASKYLQAVAVLSQRDHPTLDVDVDAHIAASPSTTILGYAETLDRPLIALASHGRGLSRLFLGSVADSVMRGAPRAVLVCRALNA